MNMTEAIAELSNPTGDPELDAAQAGIIDNLQRGYLAIAERGEDGGLRFRLTDAGRRRVEEMTAANSSATCDTRKETGR